MKEKLIKYAQHHGFDIDEALENVPSQYRTNGFTHPELPFTTNEAPKQIQAINWGLIPFWMKKPQDAMSLAKRTLNARSEELFEKNSFKAAAKRKRGIVWMSGFFENYHAADKQIYTFYIYSKSAAVLPVAGLWDEWTNAESGESNRTFTILTKEANDLLTTIHNKAKRMPAILNEELMSAWNTEEDFTQEDVDLIIEAATGQELQAYPVHHAVRGRKMFADQEENIEKADFPELKNNMELLVEGIEL